MTVQINIKKISPESYTSHTDGEHEIGKAEPKATEKYIWETGFEFYNVVLVEQIEDEDYLVVQRRSDGEDLEYRIPNVTIFRSLFKDATQSNFGVSKSLLSYTKKIDSQDLTEFYFYLKPDTDHVFLGNLIADKEDLPEGKFKFFI